VSTPACGEPVAVSVKVMAPRCVPTDPTRVNRTVAVQLAAGAKFVPMQVSESLVKAQISPAPDTVTLVTATLEPPAAVEFVNVTVPVPVRVPDGNVIVNGVIDTVPRVATLVPVKVSGEFVTVAPA